MKRQVRTTVFHVRQFVSVPYFIQLMVMTATPTTLVQFLAASAWGGITPTQGWVRGGVVGMWTTATCVAGIIGFERYEGTLIHLVMAPVGALRSLAAVVCAAASFGLVAFPVAWCTWALLLTSVSFTGPGQEIWARLAAGVLMLLVSRLALSLVIAALFVLAPNAIRYEGLLLVPVLVVSGIVFTSTTPSSWLATVGRFLPLSVSFELLLGRATSAMALGAWLVCTAARSGLAAFPGRRTLRLVTRAGTLEVV